MSATNAVKNKNPTPQRKMTSDIESLHSSATDPALSDRMNVDLEDEEDDKKRNVASSFCNGRQLVAILLAAVAGFLLWDSLITPPERRWIRPDSSDLFLLWVEGHPYWGLGAFLVVIAVAVVFMIPVGTPLTLGCGYIYKGVYGWVMGVIVATTVSMLGSALGAVTCFLLGRYMMRDRVRKWIRKYPLFDAIDTAVSEHGLRIMAMLYLTPILPLGPVSYMCGTTSMALSTFVIAKGASLPLMLLYTFVGASTGTLLSKDGGEKAEKNKSLIVMGILLSAVMIGFISRYIRKELDRILERQKQDGNSAEPSSRKSMDEAVEMGMGVARQRRLRPNTAANGSPTDNESSVRSLA